MSYKNTADLLEAAIRELARKKELAKQAAAEATPEMGRLAGLLAQLDGHTQDDRRQLLNAAGLKHISAAPKPISPVSGRHASPTKSLGAQPSCATDTHENTSSLSEQSAAALHTGTTTSGDSIGELIRERNKQLKKEMCPARIKTLTKEFHRSESAIKKHLYGPKAKKPG